MSVVNDQESLTFLTDMCCQISFDPEYSLLVMSLPMRYLNTSLRKVSDSRKKENAEAFVHRGLVLCSVGLALLQSLDGAELSCEPLEQSLLHMQRLKHPLVERPKLPQEEQMHEVDEQKHHVPHHHIQVAAVQGGPHDEESASCRVRDTEHTGFRGGYILTPNELLLKSKFNISCYQHRNGLSGGVGDRPVMSRRRSRIMCRLMVLGRARASSKARLPRWKRRWCAWSHSVQEVLFSSAAGTPGEAEGKEGSVVKRGGSAGVEDILRRAGHYLPEVSERHPQLLKHVVVELLEVLTEGHAPQAVGHMQHLSQTNPEQGEAPQEGVRGAGVPPGPQCGAEEAQGEEGEEVEEP
ncbi:hypothetical protein F7725_018985 [Dissostichus mawsoni]|uniref:Uncharacterized protein n=1 Tax=Dissostichus mawsoni TaxID=36200 RepID=A0A7J5XVW4_DISMA|nr:hypothetical protein F7725_018985 [Dissostichus mawsoni]